MRNQKVSRLYSIAPMYEYPINQSVVFYDNHSNHLNQTFGASTNSYIWTFSTWIKRTKLAIKQSILSAATAITTYSRFGFDANDKLQLTAETGGSIICNVLSQSVYRDPSAWMNIVVSVDTTQAVKEDRVVLYVNNNIVPVDFWGTGPAQNIDLHINTAMLHEIGRQAVDNINVFDGYLAETIFVDGQALDPSDFGIANRSIWTPKKYEGTFGGNGFRLDYSNDTHFGEDQSGNNNDFADRSFNTDDQVLDSPTNNFCTLNSLDLDSTGNISEGSLVVSGGTATVTMRPTTGKWYYEKDGVGVSYDCNVSGPFNPILTDGAYNFGQRPWNGSIPNGYKSLCSVNLPELSIFESGQGFEQFNYVGTGAEKVISSLKFSPDLTWIKNRTQSYRHNLIDAVRGATKGLDSSEGDIEVTTAEGLKSFDSNGFTLGTNGTYNFNGDDFASWSWLKNQGFDIVDYTGNDIARTIPHNLGVIPEFMVVKSLDIVRDWVGYHKDTGNAIKLMLNEMWEGQATTNWNSTDPTASVFSIGSGPQVNEDGNRYIAYLWASIEGFSKIFSYTGNGDVEGPFVYCGFKPKFVLIKNVDKVDAAWHIWNTNNSSFNIINSTVFPNLNSLEHTDDRADFLANGFKLRILGPDANELGSQIVGIAFAEQPFKYANAR